MRELQPINALSLAPEARDWLENSRHPRILHVFDHACNLINECREVLSIVTQQIGDGPFNVVIEADVLFSDHLDTQSPISIYANQLNIGDLTINTANAKLWSPRPDWEALHARRDDILNHLSLLRASDSDRSNPHQCEETLAPHASAGVASSQSALLAMTLPQLPLTNLQSPISSLQFSNSLISSLANADLPSSLTATQKLAGLGNGLTPAGDDFILGAVLAAWIIHPSNVARILAEEITNIAAPLTTSLSAAWLKSAGRGEAGILWHEFFNALLTGDSIGIQLQITNLLCIGHTSGADALAGLFGVFTSWEGTFRRDLGPKAFR